MALVHILLGLFVVGAVAVELFLYGLRHYELSSSPERAGHRRGALNVLASFLAQCAAVILLQLSFPLAAFWPLRPGSSPRPPIVLVHCHAGHRAQLLPLAWSLRRHGFGHVVAVNLPFGDVYRKAIRLAGEVERVLRLTGAERVDIVAHSMGGLVARAYLREHAASARVRRLVTLGTPHQGTRVAAFALDHAGRSLMPGSRMLADLARDDPVPARVSVTSIFSTFDSRILPHRNAYYPGAANVEVDGIGHGVLLLSPRVHRLVAEALS